MGIQYLNNELLSKTLNSALLTIKYYSEITPANADFATMKGELR